MEDMITAQPTIAWHRVLQDRRETVGLTRTWASLLTGLSPTTIRRAEEDPDWTPTRDTVTALTHMWGEGWQDAGVQIVDPEAEQAAALERSLLQLHALTRPSTRRKAAALGHAERTLERQNMLAASGAVSRSDLDLAQSAVTDAEAAQQAAEAAV